MRVSLEAKVDVFSTRVIRTVGGSISRGKGTKKKVAFPASKVWRFGTSTDYLVGWNVLTFHKANGTLRNRNHRLLTVCQIDEIDKLLLPELKDGPNINQVDSNSDEAVD